MKYTAVKDKANRSSYNFFEKKKLVYKYLMYTNLTNLSKKIKYKLSLTFYCFPRNSSISFLRNYCLLTNRSRSILQEFKLSRHAFKDLANSGGLSSIKKI